MIWHGVDESLLGAIEVDVTFANREDLRLLADQNFLLNAHQQRRSNGAGFGRTAQYVLLRIQNKNSRAIWGAVKLSLREGTSFEVPILHLEPNQPLPSIFLVYVGDIPVSDNFPSLQWRRLNGK